MNVAKARVRRRRQLERQAALKAKSILFARSEWNDEFKSCFQPNAKSNSLPEHENGVVSIQHSPLRSMCITYEMLQM